MIQVRGAEWNGESMVRRVDDKYRLGDRQRAPGYKRSVRAVATAGEGTECSRPKEKCFCMLGLTAHGWVREREYL
jgi:hypothetical protein